MPKGRQKVVLVDGNNMVMRSFFALPMMSSPEGLPTNAIFGTLRALRDTIDLFGPVVCLVAWDGGRESWRRKVFPEYKIRRTGQQPSNYEMLRVQFTELFDVVANVLALPQFRMLNVEADDVIAVAAWKYVKLGYDVVIVSTDHDFKQLVSPAISFYNPVKVEWIKPENFQQATGHASAGTYLDFMIVNGDSGDDVPAVKGLSGPKRFLGYLDDLRLCGLASALKAHVSQEAFARQVRKVWSRETAEKFSERYQELHRNWRLLDLVYAISQCGVSELMIPGRVDTVLFKTLTLLEMAQRYGMRTIYEDVERWAKPFRRYHG